MTARSEIDNLRGAFTWSLECSEVDRALELASALQPLWASKGRVLEGLSWFDDDSHCIGRRTWHPRYGHAQWLDRAALDTFAGFAPA